MIRITRDGPGSLEMEEESLGPKDFRLDLLRYGASWRPVDVRALGWPHDLRPERLAVLCLRCWVQRSAENSNPSPVGPTRLAGGSSTSEVDAPWRLAGDSNTSPAGP